MNDDQVFNHQEFYLSEPMPVKGSMQVTPALITWLVDNDLGHLVPAIVDQARKGKAKYGTLLETFNGRRSIVDLKQELVDALQYVTQLELEVSFAWALLSGGDVDGAQEHLDRVLRGQAVEEEEG